jgi:septal ring factor EnvC (AmiA/AmiB activator)
LIGALSCSDLPLDEIGTTSEISLSKEFEKQKGRMKPVDGKINSFIGCLNQSESIINTGCCFSENTQTYFNVDNIIAKAVADGEIVKVLSYEQRILVIIRHGVYATVYRNLDKIVVKEGDKISTDGYIGEASSNYSRTHKELLFEIYCRAKKLNPNEWVRN